MATMRAVVFRGNGEWGLDEVPVPRVETGDDVLLFLQLSEAAGAGKAVVAETSAFRRDLAVRMGADQVVDSHREDFPAKVGALTGIGADLVVEAVGTQMPEAVNCARRGGRVILFGMNAHAAAQIRPYHITRNEVTMLGSFIHRTAFPKVVRLLEAGILPVEDLVTHKLPLERIEEAFDAMRSGEAMKVAILPWQPA